MRKLLLKSATSITDLSSHVEEATERGWVYATLMFGQSQVRSGYLLFGIIRTPSLRNALRGISREFDKMSADAFGDRFGEIVAGSPEEKLAAYDGSQLAPAVPGEASASSKAPPMHAP